MTNGNCSAVNTMVVFKYSWKEDKFKVFFVKSTGLKSHKPVNLTRKEYRKIYALKDVHIFKK